MTDKKKNPRKLASPILVDEPQGLTKMLSHLLQKSIIAVDTESDSLFSYYTKVCLIQISACAHAGSDSGKSEDVIDYLVDPLAFSDLSELNKIFADSEIEVILHAADNDILTLQKEYTYTFRNVFDTQLTARILGWERTGLAKILEEHFGVISDKRMQRTDWGQRPLEPRQTEYAQLDTHYLLRLREIQLEQLAEKGRLEEAKEAFKMLEQIDYHDRPTQERTFWQMKSTRDVPRERLAVLQSLWRWREKMAQKLDRPPFKVVNDAVLTQIALDCPKNKGALNRIRGLSQYQSQRFGKALLRTVDEGLQRPQPKPPVHRPRPDTMLDDDVYKRYEALRNWRTKRARGRGVDPDIVFSNDTLLTIAKRAPQSMAILQEIAGIGSWKAKTYGAELIDVLSIG